MSNQHNHCDNVHREMMEPFELLSTKSAAMLTAARRGDWDAVISIERECSDVIQRLKSRSNPGHLDLAARTRKTAIIRRILIEDAEIRNLAQPRLAELNRMIRNAGTQRRVANAYV